MDLNEPNKKNYFAGNSELNFPIIKNRNMQEFLNDKNKLNFSIFKAEDNNSLKMFL